MKALLFLLISVVIFAIEVEIEILGSGGPEVDNRASSSYLLWIDGEAKALIDAGSGSMLQFERSSAKLETLEVILLTHMHIDHVVDLPSYIKAGYFSSRRNILPIIGPDGDDNFPSTIEYCSILFGEKGAYRYMKDVLTSQSDSFEIHPQDVNNTQHLVFNSFTVDTLKVHHGIVPSLAFRITVGEKSVVISSDTNNENHGLEIFAKGANLFIAHHAIPESAGEVAKTLHMTPSEIAQIVKKADVKKVVMSHRMKRTLEHENETITIMKKSYSGQIVFAEDLMRIRL